MAAFGELDWSRLDVQAIVSQSGLAVIDVDDYEAYRTWLAREGYAVDRIDFNGGLDAAVADFGRLKNWEQQFGYSLAAGKRNLDALRDGFSFEETTSAGRVFEMWRPDVAWLEDRRFVAGWLSIASEYSREQLALGRRFFTTLAVPRDSQIAGNAIEELRVPGFWRDRK
jgi:hypothetical protein